MSYDTKRGMAMYARKLCLPLAVLAALVLTAGQAWALGLELGESKEQLKLKYHVSVQDHGTGRITITLTIADEGRLGPLRSIDLGIPGKVKEPDGGNYMDLSVSLLPRKEDDKQVVRVHLHKDLAERASITLNTSHLDGKQEPRTWYYHSIPLAKLVKEAEEKKKQEK